MFIFLEQPLTLRTADPYHILSLLCPPCDALKPLKDVCIQHIPLKVPITLSQLYEISKIYVCLRHFLKKLNVFWFLSPFNQTTKIVILAHFPPYWIQKAAVEGLGTNYLMTSTRYLRLANISKFLSRFL